MPINLEKPGLLIVEYLEHLMKEEVDDAIEKSDQKSHDHFYRKMKSPKEEDLVSF